MPILLLLAALLPVHGNTSSSLPQVSGWQKNPTAYCSFIPQYANIYLVASIAHRRVLQLSHKFSLSNIKFVQVPYTEEKTGNRYKVWSIKQGMAHATSRDKNPSCILLKSEECKIKLLLLHFKGKLGASSEPSVPMSCTFCSGFLILSVTYWEAALSAKSSGPSVTWPLSNTWQFPCVTQSDVNQSFPPSMTDQNE